MPTSLSPEQVNMLLYRAKGIYLADVIKATDCYGLIYPQTAMLKS